MVHIDAFLCSRYFSERGEAVAKASKETHVVSNDEGFDLGGQGPIPKAEWGISRRNVFAWFGLIQGVYDRSEESFWGAVCLLEIVWFLCLFFLQMDYRCLVHERDEAMYREIQCIVLDIRGFYVSILWEVVCSRGKTDRGQWEERLGEGNVAWWMRNQTLTQKMPGSDLPTLDR